MTAHRMILTANLRDPSKITPRSHILNFCLDAEFDVQNQTYEVSTGDSFKVEVYVDLPTDADPEEYGVHMLNIVSWRGFRRPGQVFGSMLRDNRDSPDRVILCDGTANFASLTEPPAPLSGSRTSNQLLCLMPASPFLGFEMVQPARLILDRPGLFAFLVSLTLDTPDGLINLIIDPELDVGGTYPPD